MVLIERCANWSEALVPGPALASVRNVQQSKSITTEPPAGGDEWQASAGATVNDQPEPVSKMSRNSVKD